MPPGCCVSQNMLLHQSTQRWYSHLSEITYMENHLKPIPPAQDYHTAPWAHEDTSQRAFRFNHRVQRGWLDGFGQKLPDPSQPQQFDAQSNFVKWCSKHFRRHMSLKSGMRREQSPISLNTGFDHHDRSFHQQKPLPSKANSVSEPTRQLSLCAPGTWALLSQNSALLHSPLG